MFFGLRRLSCSPAASSEDQGAAGTLESWKLPWLGRHADSHCLQIRTSLNSSTNSQLPIMDIRIPPSRGRSPPDIKVLAEHLSGPGQRRAFVQFERVADAIAFVENYYPKIPLDLPNGINDRSDRSLQAYIHYARSRGDYDGRAVSNDTQWTCSNVRTAWHETSNTL